MNQIVKHKDSIRLVASLIALVTLLAYTFWHTGGLLSHYINPGWIGYVAAFGIELSVVSLSLRIGELKRSGLSVKWFTSVLVAVVTVSTIANVSEGHLTLTDSPLTWQTAQALDWMQAIIGFTSTALISLIVFSLSEIIGDDVNETIKVIEREGKRQAKSESIRPNEPESDDTLSQANDTRVEQMNRRRELVSQFVNQGMNPADIVRELETNHSDLPVSLSTVKRDLRAMSNGHQNGQGGE